MKRFAKLFFFAATLFIAQKAQAIVPIGTQNDPVITGGGIVFASTTFTSPAAASTVIESTFTGLGACHYLVVTSTVQGATGGTLDIYFQASLDGGTNWVDIAHYTQLAAAGAGVLKTFTMSSTSNTAPTAVGMNLIPALAANTVINGDFGDRIRIIVVAGASTSAGAVQNFYILGKY